jgi:glucose-1-phosphate cytidylyltransferase
MIKIGDKPILSHIMNFYQSYGHDDFIIAAGYKKDIIIDYYKNSKEFQNLKIVDTGESTMTGGRILRLQSYIDKNENFFMTYGDGLCSINLDNLTQFHLKNNKIATVTAVHPPVRFGELEIDGEKVVKFEEKPQASAGWINGGYFVLNSNVFDYIDNDQTLFEKEPMTKLYQDKNLNAFKHEGFWKCMDTLRDKISLEQLLENKGPIWKK